jgi:hypothetical protein
VSDERRLLPELLPAPAPPATRTPAERVAERARALLERFRRLGPAAGAAVLSIHCSSYGVVDPLPPPPAECSTQAQWSDSIHASATQGTPPPGAAAYPVLLQLNSGVLGVRVETVRVRGGALVKTEEETDPSFGNIFTLTLSRTDPESMDVEVDFGCAGRTATRHFQLGRADQRGLIPVMELP